MPSALTIREAARADLPAVESVLRAAGFSAQVGPLMRMPLDSPAGAIFVSCDRSGRIYGVAAALAFPASSSGWIGAVGVAPAARRRGVATALTEAAIEWLTERGVQTFCLFATDAGQPVYERLGFVSEGGTAAWRGTTSRSRSLPTVETRPLTETDRDEVATLDRLATGELRSTIFDELTPLQGVGTVGADGRLSGFALDTPWGSTSAVTASNEAAGLSLLSASTAPPRGGTLIVPRANRLASEAIAQWGLMRLNDAERMRLGPALAWRPEHQFSTFNLFWG